VTRIHILRLCICSVATVCCISGVQAQEVSVFSVLSTSSQPALAESAGFGISGVVARSRWVRVEGSFTTVSRDSRRAALVCASYIPVANCEDEQLTEEYGLRSYRLAYAPLVYGGRAVGLALKAGLSISQVVTDSRTESPRMSNLQHTRTGQEGRFLGAQLGIRPLRRLPLSIELAGVSQWVSFDGCQEHALQYAPFCGVDRFDQLQIGVSYQLGRLAPD
jgi:hypothetical protein